MSRHCPIGYRRYHDAPLRLLLAILLFTTNSVLILLILIAITIIVHVLKFYIRYLIYQWALFICISFILGLPTGRCIRSSVINTTKVCEVFAWCPVENSIENDNNLISGVLNFTLLIRNNIEFKKFQKKE